MIDSIKKNIILYKEELFAMPLISLCFFMAGHIILWLVMTFDKSSDLTSFEAGSVFALMACAFVAFFNTFMYSNRFNYALTMSQKRTGIITASMVLSAIKIISVLALLFVLNIFERHICDTVFADYELESNFRAIYKPQILLTIILAFIALETFTGALFTRFGTRFFWIIWVIVIITSQIPARVIDAVAENQSGILYSIGIFFLNCNKNVLMTILICTMLVLIALPYVILRKQRVTL